MTSSSQAMALQRSAGLDFAAHSQQGVSRRHQRREGEGLAAEGVIERVERIIGSQGIHAPQAPIEEATGPPTAVYTDPEWLALEQERIFARSWVFATRRRRARRAGPPVSHPGRRGTDRSRRFRRGGDQGDSTTSAGTGCALLVDAECARASIRCPYHHWTYGLDGSLRVRPHFHGPDAHDRQTGGVRSRPRPRTGTHCGLERLCVRQSGTVGRPPSRIG